MKKIRKVIIPVAGYGTRFLPATKAQPKEMLPIINKPVIQYIIEEAVASGIEDIILVTNFNKRSIEDHFAITGDLETYLEKQNKLEKLEEIKSISNLANFIYIRQKGPYGTGTPVLNAKHIIGDEPFAVMYGDDLFLSEKPRLKQLIEVYEKYGTSVLTAYETDDAGTNKYGIIEGDKLEDGVIKVKSILEKPGPENTKSRIASLGGYILTPDVFEILENTKINEKANELFLTDGISELIKQGKVNACSIEGEYYDTGTPMGWLRTNIAFAKNNPEYKKDLEKIIKELF